MNISIGWGGVSLASFTDLVSNLEINGMRVVQVAEGLRAANVKVLDRGNARNSLRFTVTRAPVGTVLAAEQFLLAHAIALDAAALSADIAISFNPTPDNFYLRNATLLSVRGRHIGVTTIHDYEISGGKFEDV